MNQELHLAVGFGFRPNLRGFFNPSGAIGNAAWARLDPQTGHIKLAQNDPAPLFSLKPKCVSCGAPVKRHGVKCTACAQRDADTRAPSHGVSTHPCVSCGAPVKRRGVKCARCAQHDADTRELASVGTAQRPVELPASALRENWLEPFGRRRGD